MSCAFKGLINQILTPLFPNSTLGRTLGPKQGLILGTYQWSLECAQDGNKPSQETKQNETLFEFRKTETFAHEESFREITDTGLSPRVGSGLWFTPNKAPPGSKNLLECNAGTPEREISNHQESAFQEDRVEIAQRPNLPQSGKGTLQGHTIITLHRGRKKKLDLPPNLQKRTSEKQTSSSVSPRMENLIEKFVKEVTDPSLLIEMMAEGRRKSAEGNEK